MSKEKPREKSQLRSEVEQLQERKEELSTELSDVTRKLNVLLPALRVMEGEDKSTVVASAVKNGVVPWDSFDIETIRGHGRVDALITLARFAGGELCAKDVGMILINAGVSQKKHDWQASAEAYAAMFQSTKFQKTGPGKFKLVI